MNKLQFHLMSLLIAFFSLSACKKNKSEPEPPVEETPTPPPGIYLAGAKQNGQNFYSAVAYLGKDDDRQALTTEGNQADVTDIAVWGEDIYVAGWEGMGQTNEFGVKLGVAKYWKNGQGTQLTDGTKNAQALGVSVENNIVYVCGFEDNQPTGFTKRLACYWKDGVQHFLPEVGNIQLPSCIKAHQGDVYIGGYEEIRDYAGAFPYLHDQPLYWKNGTVVQLPKGAQHVAYPMDIAVSGSDIHVVGHGKIYSMTDMAKELALYWKNGEIEALTDGNESARAYGIFLHGQDVYICGWEGSTPCYWKNGNKVILPLEPGATYGQAYAICVVGDNVYTCGESDGKGIYWKNGIPTTLTDLSRINAIWVVEE